MKKSQLLEDAQLLKKSLAQLPEPVVTPSLIMVSGLPGSGKSYFCRRLAERIPLTILESDSLRKLLFSSPNYTTQESSRLFQACHFLVEELLRRGIILALDATNLEEHHRERFYHIAEQVGARLIVVRMEAPSEVVQLRLRQRAEGINPEDHSEADLAVYRRMKPTVQRIRRNHFAVDTSKDITPVIDKIVRRIQANPKY